MSQEVIMTIPTFDRLLKGAVVLESSGNYITTVSDPIPKAEFLHEMETKNYVMVGIPHDRQ